MKAINLHFLTRVPSCGDMSLLLEELSDRRDSKKISEHEAASLRSLTDVLDSCLQNGCRAGLPGMPAKPADCLSLFDGFYFSYTIRHIGKEFDLLKVSADGGTILNIELKSESVGEERIRKQLEQNRYYLSHTSRAILSFTYVMDTQTFYAMNDRNHLRECTAEEVAAALARPVLQNCMRDGIDHLFQASDYLISPVAEPEKFLQRKYFLTNQQFDFRRRILEHLQTETAPAVSVTGPAGTGKTLLLFDLAMELSKKHDVLFVHAGPLREGHRIIDSRLRKVTIRSARERFPVSVAQTYSCLLIDEANRLDPSWLRALLLAGREYGIPLVLAYDTHHLLYEQNPAACEEEAEKAILSSATLALAFSGNIRINRPVYSFLKTLFHLKEHGGNAGYDCVRVLFANNAEEVRLAVAYFCRQGYVQITAAGALYQMDDLTAQEYDNVIMVMDENFYYNEAGYLCVKNNETEPLRLLYEGLLRTRNNLCLLVTGSLPLFLRILAAKLGKTDETESAGTDAPAS